MTDTLKAFLLTATAATLAACASTPDVPFLSGDDFGEEVADVAEDWTKGQERVEDGEKRIRSARKDIKKAEKDLKEAQRNARRAKDAIEDRQAEFATLSEIEANSPIAQGNPGALLELQAMIEDLEDDLEDARKDERKARRKLDDARDDLRKGEDMVRRGKREMADAERDYRRIK